MLERVADWQRLTSEQRHVALQRSMEAARHSPGTFISVSDRIIAPAEGILRGIPIAVKDNVDALGFPTTAGTPALGGVNPEGEASVVTAFRRAGAVTMGKTNLHELAFGVTSNNAAFGPVRHPRFPDRIAGGSSGGSATAVALGIVPLSVATDTGGSISIPAATCGIAGWRPTTGRWPGDGVVHLSWTRDTIGVHATAVTDLALADGLVTNERPRNRRGGTTSRSSTSPLRTRCSSRRRPRRSAPGSTWLLNSRRTTTRIPPRRRPGARS